MIPDRVPRCAYEETAAGVPRPDRPRTRENGRVTRARTGLRLARLSAGALAAFPVAALLAVAAARGHGGEVPPPPDLAALLFGWSFHPLVVAALVAAAAAYLWAVRRVNTAHPGNRVPADRPVFFLAGLACVAVALVSGIERYDTELFSVHMVQHILLVFGAAPALILAAPITLVLRAATPGVRHRWVLPVLRSRAVMVIGHPLVAWLLFTAVMWGSHVSPLFDAALEDPLIHDVEHALYMATALLFWWPVVGRDPSPWRLPHAARLFYLVLQMPLNSLLGVAILFSEQVLYPHYATTGRAWPPSPIEDQQLAGAIMWGVGDAGFLVAILLVIAAWMRHEEAATRRRESAEDARAAGAHNGVPTGAHGGVPAAADGTAQAEGIGASR
jgi:cytochrome c oxidase assembly factor CtaG